VCIQKRVHTGRGREHRILIKREKGERDRKFKGTVREGKEKRYVITTAREMTTEKKGGARPKLGVVTLRAGDGRNERVKRHHVSRREIHVRVRVGKKGWQQVVT